MDILRHEIMWLFTVPKKSDMVVFMLGKESSGKLTSNNNKLQLPPSLSCFDIILLQ